VKWLLIMLAGAPFMVFAQPFIEVGVGAVTGGCLFDKASVQYANRRVFQSIDCSRNPLGLLAIGYQFDDRWRIQWDHWSSLPDVDRGAEIVSIRYRYTFR